MSVAPIGIAQSLLTLVTGYLGQRGLTMDDAFNYGMQVLSATEIYPLLGFPVRGVPRHLGGIWIPQFQPNGQPYRGAGQGILFKSPGFGVTPKPDKYCTRGSNNPSFTLMEGGWNNLSEGTIVVVCESVIKATLVNKVLGWPTIGLMGVEGWSAGNRSPHVDLMNPALWASLRALVLFDSLSTISEKSREGVSRAIDTVEEILSALGGAELVRVRLPDIQPSDKFPKGQWGVDDFVVAHGPAALVELSLRATPVPQEEANPTARQVSLMNRLYGVLSKPVRVVSVEDPRDMWSFTDFRNLHLNITVREAGMRGNRVRVQNSTVADVWYRHPQRRNVSRLVWAPGEDKLVNGGLNMWRGMAIEPAETSGKAEPYWYATVVKALGEDGKMLVNLLAWMVQHPEHKIGWYVYIYGRPGTGKNYIFEPLKYIFGTHCMAASPEMYLNKFNAYFSAARVIIFSEMDEHMDNSMASKFEAELKLESDHAPHMRIVEAKGAERVSVERLANVFMFSNYHPPWKIRKGDRRGLFLQTWDGMRPTILGGTKDPKYWEARWNWLTSDTGPAEVLRFLLEWPLKDLPAIPPETEYKKRLFGASAVGDMGEILEEFLATRPEGLEGVFHIRASDLVALTYGPASEEVINNRILNSAGRKLQLHGSLFPCRSRVPGWGTDAVRYYTLNGGMTDGVNAGRSFDEWKKYWSR